MKARLLVLFAIPFLILTGCATDNTPAPTPLANLAPTTLHIKSIWSRALTNGNGGQYFKIGSTLEGQTLVTAGVSGHVVAVNLATGDVLWKQSLPAAVSATPGLNAKEAFVGTTDGMLYALDITNGKLKWHMAQTSLILSAPAADSDTVVVQTHDATINAYATDTGSLLWSYNATLPALSLYANSSPLLYNDRAFIGFSNGQLGAFDLQNGGEAWQVPVAIPASPDNAALNIVGLDGTPILDQGVIFATSYHGTLSAVNAENGQIIWQKPLSSFESPAIQNGKIFVTDDIGNVIAINERSSQTIWTESSLRYRSVTGPAVLGNLVIVGDYAGYLHFLSILDGHEIARFQVSNAGINATPLVYNHYVIVTTESGTVAVLQPTG